MSFFKHLLSNWFGGGKYGSGGHHGGGGGKHGYYNKHSQMPPYGMPGSPPPTQQVSCPKCSTSNDVQSRFCQQCGGSLVGGACSGCNQPLKPGDKFCAKCGKQQ